MTRDTYSQNILLDNLVKLASLQQSNKYNPLHHDHYSYVAATPDLSLVSTLSASVWSVASVLLRRTAERLRRTRWLQSSARRQSRAGVTGPQQQQPTVHLKLKTTTNKDFFNSRKIPKQRFFVHLTGLSQNLSEI